jgi:hypothetical protein
MPYGPEYYDFLKIPPTSISLRDNIIRGYYWPKLYMDPLLGAPFYKDSYIYLKEESLIEIALQARKELKHRPKLKMPPKWGVAEWWDKFVDVAFYPEEDLPLFMCYENLLIQKLIMRILK